MPRVIITEDATKGLERCGQFFASQSPRAAKQVSQVIAHLFELLETEPHLGRPLNELTELREVTNPVPHGKK